MVGIGQFARGMTRERKPRHRLTGWLLSVLPIAVVAIWVVARVTRHL